MNRSHFSEPSEKCFAHGIGTAIRRPRRQVAPCLATTLTQKGGHLSSFSRHFNRPFSRHFSGHSVGISVGTFESKSILYKRDFTPPCDPTAPAHAFGVHFGQAGRATPLRRANASLRFVPHSVCDSAFTLRIGFMGSAVLAVMQFSFRA